MIPLDLLIAPLTADQAYEKLLDRIEQAGLPARSWRTGGVAQTITAACAYLGYQGAAIVRELARGNFLLLGRGVYLRAHAKDVYDVDYFPASFAAGKVRLTNAGGAVYTLGPDELVVRSSTTKARFRVRGIAPYAAPYVIPALSYVDVDVEAFESGSASSVGPGQIDELETPLTKVTVSNAAAIIGTDDETDESLVRRCLTKKGTWSPFGPRDAYEHAALSALLPGGTPTGVTRVRVSRSSSVGLVTVTCATASGTPTGDALDAVRAECEHIARADTDTLVVQGAVPKPTAHTVILWCNGGTEAILRERAIAAMSKLIATYPIGGLKKSDGSPGYLFADAVAGALVGSSPEAFDVDDVGADILLNDNEVATNTTTVTVRIR